MADGWSPAETRKLIGLIAGIGMMVAGVALVWTDVQAGGSINITSALVSGEIESGSAGLLLCFLSVFVIALTTIGRTTGTRQTANPSEPVSSGALQAGLDTGDSDAFSLFQRWTISVVMAWLVVTVLTLLSSGEARWTAAAAGIAMVTAMVAFPATMWLLFEWIAAGRRGGE